MESSRDRTEEQEGKRLGFVVLKTRPGEAVADISGNAFPPSLFVNRPLEVLDETSETITVCLGDFRLKFLKDIISEHYLYK